MIKDRLLKEQLLKYFVRRNWYPELEINVISKQRLSKIKKLITDIDVIGAYPDSTGKFKTIIGDCKTLKGVSPISRVLWLKGLMSYFEAEKGVILLTKSIEKEHQFNASILDIQLMTDSDFSIFAKNSADYINPPISSLEEIANWEAFFLIFSRFPALKPYELFCNTDFWNDKVNSSQLRSGLVLMRETMGEIDPGNNFHLSVILNHLSLLAISLQNIVMQIFNRYSVPNNQLDLDEDLKLIIYGGLENYEFMNSLRKKFANNMQTEDLQLPSWREFIELVRLLLESPLLFSDVPLLLKELSYTLLSKDKIRYTKASAIIARNKQVQNYAVRHIDYFCKATKAPSELNKTLSSIALTY